MAGAGPVRELTKGKRNPKTHTGKRKSERLGGRLRLHGLCRMECRASYGLRGPDFVLAAEEALA